MKKERNIKYNLLTFSLIILALAIIYYINLDNPMGIITYERLEDSEMFDFILEHLDEYKSKFNLANEGVLEKIEILDYKRYESIEDVLIDDLELSNRIIEFYKDGNAGETEIIFLLIDFSYTDNAKEKGPEFASDGVRGTYVIVKQNNETISVVHEEPWLQ